MWREDIESEWLWKHSIEMAEALLSGSVGLGDFLYSSRELHNVRIVSLPRRDEIEEFIHLRRSGQPAALYIGYETLRGGKGVCPIACLSKIPSGSFSSEYYLLGGARDEYQRVRYFAKMFGVRYEVSRRPLNGFVFTFYGDTQKEVDRLKNFLEHGILCWD